jgi:hypothetical protein
VQTSYRIPGLGHVFNGAATITDTVAGNNSCDTIRTLTLAVNPLLTSTQNITVCANQLPYTWLGHVFNGAATITDTVAGNNSCDTIRTLTLAVNPLLTSTQNITVCANQLPYTWLGSCVQRGSDDHGYSCGQQQLRYNKNIDTCRKSAADINTKHHGLCKPVTVYLVGSCVHRGSDDHGYSCGQQQLRYNKNIDTCRKSAADINTKHHGLCEPVTVYLAWVMCSTGQRRSRIQLRATTVAIQ